MRVCRNSHKLKITLATGSCSEGDFDKKGILTHLHSVYAEFNLQMQQNSD